MPLAALAGLDIARIDIIATTANPAAADLANAIRYALKNSNPTIETNVNTTENYSNSNPSNTLAISVGDGSLNWIDTQKNGFAAVIAFNANSLAFTQRYKGNPHITAIYRDQPLSCQLRLAKFLLPNLKHVSLLRNAAIPSQLFIEAAQNLQIDIDVVDADKRPEWLKSLSLSLRQTDALIGIDDTSLYNSDTIRGILLTTYRQGKSLIGPSRAFVNAGSLASCYTPTDQLLQQLTDMVATLLREQRVPDAQFPKVIRVVVNRQVATSLNIPIPDEETLSAWSKNYSGECRHGC